MRIQIRSDIREEVFERDGYTCRYCGNKEGPFHADHVYPSSKGGETSIENLVTACVHCNTKKQAKVGLWPKPIGYWEEPKKITRETYQNGALIMIGLLYGGIGLLLPVPDDLWGTAIRITTGVSFVYALACVAQWVAEAMSK